MVCVLVIRRPQRDESLIRNDRRLIIGDSHCETATWTSLRCAGNRRLSNFKERSRRMITGNCAAAFSGRFGVIDDCATLTGVIRDADVFRTSEYASNFSFKSADVSAVTGCFIWHAGIVNCSRLTALISCGASRDAGIDRIAAWLGFHGLRGTTIVRKRCQHRIGADEITGSGEACRLGS